MKPELENWNTIHGELSCSNCVEVDRVYPANSKTHSFTIIQDQGEDEHGNLVYPIITVPAKQARELAEFILRKLQH